MILGNDSAHKEKATPAASSAITATEVIISTDDAKDTGVSPMIEFFNSNNNSLEIRRPVSPSPSPPPAPAAYFTVRKPPAETMLPSDNYKFVKDGAAPLPKIGAGEEGENFCFANVLITGTCLRFARKCFPVRYALKLKIYMLRFGEVNSFL